MIGMQHEQEPRNLPFSETTIQVMQSARNEAKRLNHNYIGTEHILLGLVGEEIFRNIPLLRDLDLSKIPQIVESIVGRGESSASRSNTREIVLSLRSEKVIELASKEANEDGVREVKPIHLLIGIMREGKGIAAGILSAILTEENLESPLKELLVKMHLESARGDQQIKDMISLAQEESRPSS